MSWILSCVSFSFGWFGEFVAPLIVVKFFPLLLFSVLPGVVRSAALFDCRICDPCHPQWQSPGCQTVLQASYFGPKECMLSGPRLNEVIVLRLWQSWLPFFEGSWISTSALLSVIWVGVFPLGLMFGPLVFGLIQFSFCFLHSVIVVLNPMSSLSVEPCGGLFRSLFPDSIAEIARIVSVLQMSHGKPADLGRFRKSHESHARVQNGSLVTGQVPACSGYFRIEPSVCCRWWENVGRRCWPVGVRFYTVCLLSPPLGRNRNFVFSQHHVEL